jgi:hypothetical protein
MSNWQTLTSLVMDQCLSSFGEDVIYVSDGGSPVTFTAIFDNEFQTVDPQTGALVISTQPVIGVKSTDLPDEPSKEDRVTIRGVEYRIIDHQPDGQAGTRLFLHKL